ncbi:MAG: Uma2 family endonuclease, partial [Nostoc sp.]|uniref:Uma2 family endonuclease n=1 Tax=Nostoc sp. TaxID=1180 RepID=UPI002FF781A0
NSTSIALLTFQGFFCSFFYSEYPESDRRGIIIEILSASTGDTDKGLKKQIYQEIFRTPDYFWFDPETLEFSGYHLLDGKYQPLEPNPQGWLWSQQLGLYLGVYQENLRFYTPEGELVPTPEEVAQHQKQRSDRLAARLRELNIDPPDII